jgi:uncharacterized protein YjbJ (UPF0337 family)
MGRSLENPLEGEEPLERVTQLGGFGMSASDKAKNKAQSAKGKAKEATGRAAGDRSLQEKGKAHQVSGDLKQAGEKVKDAFKH